MTSLTSTSDVCSQIAQPYEGVAVTHTTETPQGSSAAVEAPEFMATRVVQVSDAIRKLAEKTKMPVEIFKKPSGGGFVYVKADGFYKFLIVHKHNDLNAKDEEQVAMLEGMDMRVDGVHGQFALNDIVMKLPRKSGHEKTDGKPVPKNRVSEWLEDHCEISFEKYPSLKYVDSGHPSVSMRIFYLHVCAVTQIWFFGMTQIEMV